jgi:hypothetical protein
VIRKEKNVILKENSSEKTTTVRVQNFNEGRRELATAPARSLYEQGFNAKIASSNEGTDCHGQGEARRVGAA